MGVGVEVLSRVGRDENLERRRGEPLSPEGRKGVCGKSREKGLLRKRRRKEGT